MKRFVFFSLLIVPISVFAEGGLPDNPYIYIEGTAEIQKPADIVDLRFEVVCRAADQPKANEQLQAEAAVAPTPVVEPPDPVGPPSLNPSPQTTSPQIGL